MATDDRDDLQKIIDHGPVVIPEWQRPFLMWWIEQSPLPPVLRPRIHGPRPSHVIIDEIHKTEQP